MELTFLDRMNEEWDPHTEVEVVLRHRHINYARRNPGKFTYNPNVPLVTSKGVRLFYCQYFSGVKSWVPREAVRHPEWEWVKEYSTDELEEFRQSFIAKYENTPKYKFGVQIRRYPHRSHTLFVWIN
jgi:hypothetical protein